MTQPIKKGNKTISKPKKNRVKKQKYGTSKLEQKFAKEFLDKLNIKYIYQYEAKPIKRFYDFYCYEQNAIIEVDGDYWHSYGKVYEEMTPTQKKNARVDKIKNEWALSHGIPIIRVWEHDINNNPQKVFSILRENIGIATEKMIINENKKKRH